MRSAILCFPALDWEQIQIPIGLYKIAKYCEDYYNVIIVDARLEHPVNRINEILETEDVLCVGLSVMIGSQITYAKELSKTFHGGVPIVWGGTFPTLFPEMVLKEHFVDSIIRGDGEAAFLVLLEHLDFFAKPPPYGKDINFLPKLQDCTQYDTVKIPAEYFIKRDGLQRAIAIESSRGCPHRCAFCHNTFLKHDYRSISSKAVVASVKSLFENYKIDGIILQEDNLFYDKKRAFDIMRGLCAFPGVKWKANSHIRYFSKIAHNSANMELLLSSGCTMLQFGIESGNERILEMMRKNITISEVLNVNSLLSKFPIKIRYNFIIGLPTETLSEVESTLSLAERLQEENPNAEPPFVNIYTPLPGTPLYDFALKDGFLPPKSLDEWAAIHWNYSDSLRWPRKISPYLNRATKQALSSSRYLK